MTIFNKRLLPRGFQICWARRTKRIFVQAFSLFVVWVALIPCFSFAFAVMALQGERDGNQHTLDYRIWKIWPATKNGLTVVFASVNPKHLNREEMAKLAKQLNKDLEHRSKLRVFLWDDDEQARLYAEGFGLDYMKGFEDKLRAIYILDRTKCEEYIEFSPDANKPKEKVKIRFECTSPRN